MQEEPSALLSRSSRDHDSRSSRVSLKEGGMSSSTCTTPTPGSATIKPPGTPEPNRSSTPRSRDADRERSSPTPTTRSSSPMLHHPLNGGGGRSLDRQMSGNRSRTPPLLPGIPHLPPNVSSTSSLLPRPPSASTIPVSGLPPNFRPFLTPPGGHGGHGGGPQGTTAPFPMWPLPGLFPGHPAALFNPVRDMQDIKPLSPVTKDRSKLGDKGDMPPLMPRENGDKDGYERHNGDHMDPYGPDGPLGHHKSPKMPPYPNGGKNGGAGDIAGYVPTQRLEWKRYKQYTRSDIMAAIEEVKKGKSALQVSKKFNIPSRTLYDKVKKMGITTGRQQQRKSMGSNFNAYTAAFPGMNMMSPLSRLDSINLDNPYKDLMERMREARDEEDRDSRESEGLPAAGTLSHHPHSGNAPPPFSILSPQMLNMMDRMKADLPPRPHSVGEGRQSSGEGERTSGDGGDTSPMNLSSEREDKQRASEGSIPQSPSPGSTELTSPSNPHTSPSGGDYRHSRRSPPPHPAPIDIRAQFLADLRHNLSMSAHSPHSLHHHPMVSAHLPHAARGLVAPAYHHRRHRSDSPIHADETEDERGVSIDERADNEDTRASSPDDNDRGSTSTPNNGHDLSSKSPVADSLPPRKRRLSGSLAADSSTSAAAKLGAPGLNGLHGLGHPEDSQPSATQVN